MSEPLLPFNVKQCRFCGKHSSEHGSLKTLEHAYIVCPGDYIVKTREDEYEVIKREKFEREHEEVK